MSPEIYVFVECHITRYFLFQFSMTCLQWIIDSAATENWHTGSLPDDRAMACLKKHGITTDHRVRKVQYHPSLNHLWHSFHIFHVHFASQDHQRRLSQVWLHIRNGWWEHGVSQCLKLLHTIILKRNTALVITWEIPFDYSIFWLSILVCTGRLFSFLQDAWFWRRFWIMRRSLFQPVMAQQLLRLLLS